MKEKGYYSEERNDVRDLMDVFPNTTVFDVGCGEGGLGRSLKRIGCENVFGMELLPDVAEKAKSHYKMVFTGNIETFCLPFNNEFFDYIVCADVLEHLNDPWVVLKKLRSCLKREGYLIASLPNMRNRATLGDLLRGNFDYQDWGIMDNTHMRFFTLNSMIKLFEDTGYLIREVKPHIDSDMGEHIPFWNHNHMKERIRDMVKLLINIDYFPSEDDLQELFTIQFIFKVMKNRE